MKTYQLNGLDVLSDGSSNFLHGVGVDEHLNVSGPNNLRADYLTDHLGSTNQLIDSSNVLSKARLDYKSYGKLEGDSSNPVASNPYTYTGREDDGTGLYYYRNRYYDPELEVFVSQDPLGDAQRYVSGNPLSFNDPMGLFKFPQDPSGLSNDWQLDTKHLNPNGQRFKSCWGDIIEYHTKHNSGKGHGQGPHWHWKTAATYEKLKDHYQPGDEIDLKNEFEGQPIMMMGSPLLPSASTAPGVSEPNIIIRFPTLRFLQPEFIMP